MDVLADLPFPLVHLSTSPIGLVKWVSSFLQAIARLPTGGGPWAQAHRADGPLVSLNLDESQALSAWRIARHMPRPSICERLLKRVREHLGSRRPGIGQPIPGRRLVRPS